MIELFTKKAIEEKTLNEIFDLAGERSETNPVPVEASGGISSGGRFIGSELEDCNFVSGTIGSGVALAAGSTNEIQYNKGSRLLGASSNFTWDNTNKELILKG